MLETSASVCVKRAGRLSFGLYARALLAPCPHGFAAHLAASPLVCRISHI